MTKRSAAGIGQRILKGSFWLVALIHIAVFAAIGAASGEWRLLVTFLVGFTTVTAIYGLFRFYRRP
jgi:hypothetical protein